MNRNKLRKVNSAGAVVFRILELNDCEILFVRSKLSRSWGIPKGHVEKNESLHSAAVREVKEETGLDVELNTSIDLPVVITKNKKEIKKVHSWLARVQQKIVELNPTDVDEIDEISWFSINDLPYIHMYQQPLLHKAIEEIKRLYLQ